MPDAAASSTTSPHTLETFRPLLKQLILSLPITSLPETRTLPSPLSPGELQSLFSHLSDPSFTSNHAHQAQLGSVLSGLRLGGLDARADTLSIASENFLKRSVAVEGASGTSDRNAENRRREVATRIESEEGWAALASRKEVYEGTLDLVGTGGDGQDTFNVSTTAAIVASGVPGVRVCKHGAKASSSTSGSADLLLSLGIPLLSLTPPIISTLLPTSSFVFLFAQLFHPALAPLGPIRRALGHPTIFNVLGPLINPARPARCILGVHSAYLGDIFAQALRKRGDCQRAWVVCGREGLDEISIEGETDVWELQRDGQIAHFVISPETFGLPRHPLAHVASHSSDENAAIVLHLTQQGHEADLTTTEPLSEPLRLTPTGAEDEATAALLASLPPIPAGTHLRAVADYTLLQTAALLYVGGYADDYQTATSLARYSLNSGSALRSLEAFRSEATREVAKAQHAEQQQQQQQRAAEEEEEEQRKVQAQKDLRDSVDRRRDSFFYAPEPIRSIGVGTTSD